MAMSHRYIRSRHHGRVPLIIVARRRTAGRGSSYDGFSHDGRVDSWDLQRFARGWFLGISLSLLSWLAIITAVARVAR